MISLKQNYDDEGETSLDTWQLKTYFDWRFEDAAKH